VKQGICYKATFPVGYFIEKNLLQLRASSVPSRSRYGEARRGKSDLSFETQPTKNNSQLSNPV